MISRVTNEIEYNTQVNNGFWLWFNFKTRIKQVSKKLVLTRFQNYRVSILTFKTERLYFYTISQCYSEETKSYIIGE